MTAGGNIALAYALILASGSIHAVVNAILKSGRSLLGGRAIIDGTSALLMLPALAFVPPPHGAWGWLLASAALHLVYLFALVRALEAADFSASYPVLRGTAPLVSAAIAIGLLREPASLPQIPGIAAIGGGMFLMVAGRHIGGAALGWAVFTGITIAGYTVIDAHGVRAAPDPFSYIVWFFFLFGSGVALVFGWLSRDGLPTIVRTQWKAGAAAGLLSIVTYGLALYAFSLGPTAPIAALRETGMVTALLIAIFVMKERVSKGRIVGVFALLCGAAAILSA